MAAAVSTARNKKNPKEKAEVWWLNPKNKTEGSNSPKVISWCDLPSEFDVDLVAIERLATSHKIPAPRSAVSTCTEKLCSESSAMQR